MTKLSLSKAWDETRATIARDGRLIGAVALAMFFLPGVVAEVIDPSREQLPSSTTELILATAVGLIALVGQLAMIRLALESRTSVGEAISHGARRAPNYVVACIILVLPFAVAAYFIGLDVYRDPQHATPGALLATLVLVCVLVFIGIRMAMASSVATAETVGPLDILKRSWQLTRGHWWRLFAFFLLFVLVEAIVLGAIGLIVGIAVQMLFGDVEPLTLAALVSALFTQLAVAVITTGFIVMLARIYVQLSGPATVSVPSSAE